MCLPVLLRIDQRSIQLGKHKKVGQDAPPFNVGLGPLTTLRGGGGGALGEGVFAHVRVTIIYMDLRKHISTVAGNI